MTAAATKWERPFTENHDLRHTFLSKQNIMKNEAESASTDHPGSITVITSEMSAPVLNGQDASLEGIPQSDPGCQQLMLI